MYLPAVPARMRVRVITVSWQLCETSTTATGDNAVLELEVDHAHGRGICEVHCVSMMVPAIRCILNWCIPAGYEPLAQLVTKLRHERKCQSELRLASTNPHYPE